MTQQIGKLGEEGRAICKQTGQNQFIRRAGRKLATETVHENSRLNSVHFWNPAQVKQTMFSALTFALTSALTSAVTSALTFALTSALTSALYLH